MRWQKFEQKSTHVIEPTMSLIAYKSSVAKTQSHASKIQKGLLCSLLAFDPPSPTQDPHSTSSYQHTAPQTKTILAPFNQIVQLK
jgi:hypothetical protein